MKGSPSGRAPAKRVRGNSNSRFYCGICISNHKKQQPRRGHSLSRLIFRYARRGELRSPANSIRTTSEHSSPLRKRLLDPHPRDPLGIRPIYYNNDYLKNAKIHYNYGEANGDISGDGTTTLDDAIYSLRAIADTTELSEEDLSYVDLSGDGNFTVLDVVLLQKTILEAPEAEAVSEAV